MRKAAIIILLINFTYNTIFPQETGTFTDTRDNKEYSVVKIGNQIWMSENLNFSIEGSAIYEYNAKYGDIYGRLYDWEAARNACPEGWKLPSDNDWKILEQKLGLTNDSIDLYGLRKSIVLKSSVSRNGNSGFNIDYGGWQRAKDLKCFHKGKAGFYWTSDEKGSKKAIIRKIVKKRQGIYRIPARKDDKFSVRCINTDGEFVFNDSLLNKYKNESTENLTKALKIAIEKENQEEAKSIQDEIERREFSKLTLEELQKLEKEALEKNDYEKANKIKNRIDQLQPSVKIINQKTAKKDSITKTNKTKKKRKPVYENNNFIMDLSLSVALNLNFSQNTLFDANGINYRIGSKWYFGGTENLRFGVQAIWTEIMLYLFSDSVYTYLILPVNFPSPGINGIYAFSDKHGIEFAYNWAVGYELFSPDIVFTNSIELRYRINNFAVGLIYRRHLFYNYNITFGRFSIIAGFRF